MDFILDIINLILDFVLYRFIIPVINVIDYFMQFIFSPFIKAGDMVFLFTVSFVCALVSTCLSFYFKEKKTKEYDKELKEKISSLKYLDDIEEKKLKQSLKKGINDSADKAYENILIEKFFNAGITYFFPMFFFLIWIDYSVFDQNFKTIGFFHYKIPASIMFIILFNLILVLIFFINKYFLSKLLLNSELNHK